MKNNILKVIDTILFIIMFISILFDWNNHLQLILCAIVALLSAYIHQLEK